MEEKPASLTGRRLFILLAVFVLLGIAVGTIVAVKSDSISYTSTEEGSPTDNQLLYVATNISIDGDDNDRDGLKNWEEALWGTDKDNPDTDGDGTSDGDEVSAGRDPTRPFPDDVLVSSASRFITSEDNNYNANNLTETDKFAQKFFTSYISRRGSSPLTAASQNALVSELARELPSIVANSYDAGDLSSIVSDTKSKESLHAYGNKLGDILNTYGKPDVGHELDILTKALNEKSEEELAKLDLIIESHQTVVANYLVMSVPEIAVSNHLGFINAISALEASLSALQNVLDDPLIALSGVRAYNISAEELARQFTAMGAFLLENSLEFNINEGGYLFTNFGSL